MRMISSSPGRCSRTRRTYKRSFAFARGAHYKVAGLSESGVPQRRFIVPYERVEAFPEDD